MQIHIAIVTTPRQNIGFADLTFAGLEQQLADYCRRCWGIEGLRGRPPKTNSLTLNRYFDQMDGKEGVTIETADITGLEPVPRLGVLGRRQKMTDAQKLTEEFRQITAPGSLQNTLKWAKRATEDLEFIGNSTIGDRKNSQLRHGVALFRCADGSRFGYDLNGARQVWAMPDDRDVA